MVEIIGGGKQEPQGERPRIIIPGAPGAEESSGPPKPQGDSKIQVDEDWKDQARREAQELDEQTAPAKAGEELPPADFLNFAGGLVEQCLMELGAVVHPVLGQRVVNPPMARYTIEVLDMLRQKTQGNLSDEENKFLDSSLHTLRVQFMNVTKQLLAAAERGELKTIANPGEPPMGAVPPKE